MLKITMSRKCTEDPQPDPNPPGPTPGTTPKSPPKSNPGFQSPAKGSTGEEEIMKGRYTCYPQPCTNCADPLPSHLSLACPKEKNENIRLLLLWTAITHKGIQLLTQAQRWNQNQTADMDPCCVCGEELKDHDLRKCILRAQIRVDGCGQFTAAASIEKENLNCCAVNALDHIHETAEEMKKCYLTRH